MTPGEIFSLLSASLAALTFIRTMVKESSAAQRQVELLTKIDELRKEMAECYLSQQVWQVERARIWDRIPPQRGRTTT